MIEVMDERKKTSELAEEVGIWLGFRKAKSLKNKDSALWQTVQLALITCLISFAVAFAVSSAFSAEAIITGPNVAQPGDLVILDASESKDATAYQWRLTNSEKSFLPIEEGKKIVFASGKAGIYRFVLAAAGVDEETVEADVSLAIHEVVIGTPEPTPPIPPNDKPGLAAKVADWLTKVDAAKAANLKAVLLANFETVAKADTLKHADQVFSGILQASNEAGAFDASALKPFGDSMLLEINRLMGNGTIKTPADYAKTIQEIGGAM